MYSNKLSLKELRKSFKDLKKDFKLAFNKILIKDKKKLKQYKLQVNHFLDEVTQKQSEFLTYAKGTKDLAT